MLWYMHIRSCGRKHGYFMVLCNSALLIHTTHVISESLQPQMCSCHPLTIPCAACPVAGQDAWLNPVEPKLPEDYTPGELHLASDKAASAVIAAAVAAGLQPPKVIVKAT